MDNGGDHRIAQSQPILPRNRARLRCEASLVERPIEHVSGAIASEHAPRTVGAMGSRSKPNDEQLCIGLPEVGDRMPPVVPLLVCTAFALGNLLAKRPQPRTALAGNDAPLEGLPLSRAHASLG